MNDRILLLEAARSLDRIYKLIEEGKLVRDTIRDDEPDWALKMMRLVSILAEASAVLNKLKQEGLISEGEGSHCGNTLVLETARNKSRESCGR